MDEEVSVRGQGKRRGRRIKQTKVAREMKYHTTGDDDGGAGVREPRRPVPVVGPQQAEMCEEETP